MTEQSPSNIVFISDFGLQDPYVAQVKGVIYAINPDTRVIDLTHDITPYDMGKAAVILEKSHEYFPYKTIFLSVVDPGVGSERKCLVLKTLNYYFIAPDNGILTPFLKDSVVECRSIENRRYFRKTQSNTFHGRDIMGPVAGHLSVEDDIKNFGPIYQNPVTIALPEPVIESERIKGSILFFDRFGNAITNISKDNISSWCSKFKHEGPFMAKYGEVDFPFKRFYSEAGPGEPLSLFSSYQQIELSVNQGNAEMELGLTKGKSVIFTAYTSKSASSHQLP